MLGALQQPFVERPGVLKVLLLDLKVYVGLPQHLQRQGERERETERQRNRERHETERET